VVTQKEGLYPLKGGETKYFAGQRQKPPPSKTLSIASSHQIFYHEAFTKANPWLRRVLKNCHSHFILMSTLCPRQVKKPFEGIFLHGGEG